MNFILDIYKLQIVALTIKVGQIDTEAKEIFYHLD